LAKGDLVLEAAQLRGEQMPTWIDPSGLKGGSLDLLRVVPVGRATVPPRSLLAVPSRGPQMLASAPSRSTGQASATAGASAAVWSKLVSVTMREMQSGMFDAGISPRLRNRLRSAGLADGDRIDWRRAEQTLQSDAARRLFDQMSAKADQLLGVKK